MFKPIVLIGEDFGSLQQVLEAWSVVYPHYRHVVAADLMCWWLGNRDAGERLARQVDPHLILRASFDQPPALARGSEVKLLARDEVGSEYMLLQDPDGYRFFGAQWQLTLYVDLAQHRQIAFLINGAKEYGASGRSISGLTVVER